MRIRRGAAPYPGWGWDTALPISAPGWQLGCMYQLRRETGRAPRGIKSPAAPHRPLLLAEWVRGGEIHKDRTTHPKFKARQFVRHFYLLPVRHNLLFGR